MNKLVMISSFLTILLFIEKGIDGHKEKVIQGSQNLRIADTAIQNFMSLGRPRSPYYVKKEFCKPCADNVERVKEKDSIGFSINGRSADYTPPEKMGSVTIDPIRGPVEGTYMVINGIPRIERYGSVKFIGPKEVECSNKVDKEAMINLSRWVYSLSSSTCQFTSGQHYQDKLCTYADKTRVYLFSPDHKKSDWDIQVIDGHLGSIAMVTEDPPARMLIFAHWFH